MSYNSNLDFTSDPHALPDLVPIPQSIIDHQFNFPLPVGELTLLIGNPGVGKSLLALDLAARSTLGRPFPPSDPHLRLHPAHCPMYVPFGSLFRPGEVVYLSKETHDPSSLTSAFGIHFALCFKPGPSESSLIPEKDPIYYKSEPAQHQAPLLRYLEHHFDNRRFHNLRLLILDPLPDFLGPINAASTTLRNRLLPLIRLAHDRQFAILGISHTTKQQPLSPDPVHLTLGSLAYSSLARCILLLTRDPSPTPSPRLSPQHSVLSPIPGTRRLLVPIKYNFAPLLAAYAFSFHSRPSNPRTQGQFVPPDLLWEPDPILHHPLLQNASPDPEPRPEDPFDASQFHLAQHFLSTSLQDGPQPASLILTQARSLGISQRTLARARHKLQIQCHKSPSHWLLSLPDSALAYSI